MRFSIIIPTYNLEDYVDDTIKALLEQPYSDFEIIAVDNNSTDNTLYLLHKYEELDARVKVYSNLHEQGVSSTRNLGIEKSTGDWICFIDGDDICDPCYLVSWVKMIELKSDVDFISSDYYIWFANENKKEKGTSLNESWRGCFSLNKDFFIESDLVDLFLRTNCFVLTGAVCIARPLLEKTGLFDTSIKTAEDTHFWYRLAYHSKLFACLATTAVFYRQREGSLSNGSSGRHGDAPAVFLSLSKMKEFFLYREIFRIKAMHHMKLNVYHFRSSGQKIAAIKSAFQAFWFAPLDKANVKNLIASMLLR
jgi:glycosyltransferase involved in cell wall biosynthesis